MNYIPLSKEQEDACLRSVDYTREQLCEDVQTLRRWLNEQQHLPPARLKESDHFLKNFLVCCKGSLEKAKQKIDSYYTLRSADTAIFQNFNPLGNELIGMKEKSLIGCLPKCLEDGSEVFFDEFTETFDNSFHENLQTMVMLMELTLRREDTTPVQIIMVNDAKRTKVDVTKPGLIRAVRDSAYLMEAYPLRPKHIVYLNAQPSVVYLINYLLKPILSKKIADRIIIFPGGWECLSEMIPKDIMPKEGNGAGPSIKEMSDHFYKVIAVKSDWFANDLCEKTDESKRPPNNPYKSTHPYFGAEGSFKSLRID